MTLYGTWTFKGKQREHKTPIYVGDVKEKRGKKKPNFREQLAKRYLLEICWKAI